MIHSFFTILFRDVRRQPLRTTLTVTGVIWGTFAIVILMSFGHAVGKENFKAMRGFGKSIVIFFPGSTTQVYRGLPKGRPITITVDNLATLTSHVPGIIRLSPEFQTNKRIRYGRSELLSVISGVNSEFEMMRNTIPGQGRFLNTIDLHERRRVCFLGNRIAGELFSTVDPIGESVLIEGLPFTVIGVMKAKKQESNYGTMDENIVYLPWTTFSSLYGATTIDLFLVQVADPATSESLVRLVREHLGPRLGFNPADTDALPEWNFTEMERGFQAFNLALEIFLGMIGAFTLLVSGIGVASIMNVVVEERRREIGIKLAVGAKRRHIMFQFFLEAMTIVAVGGIAGLTLAALLLAILPVEQMREFVGVPTLSLPLALITIAILLVIGTLSSMIPARKAATTSPIEALRS